MNNSHSIARNLESTVVNLLDDRAPAPAVSPRHLRLFVALYCTLLPKDYIVSAEQLLLLSFTTKVTIQESPVQLIYVANICSIVAGRGTPGI